MCKVRCRQHNQCSCECRPLHFQRRRSWAPTGDSQRTHNVATAIDQRQIHAHWRSNLYLYASYQLRGQFVYHLAHKNHFDRP